MPLSMEMMKNYCAVVTQLYEQNKNPGHMISSGRICRQADYIHISSLLLSGLYRRPRNFTGSCPTLDSWASLASYHRSGIGSFDPHPAPKVFILYMIFGYYLEYNYYGREGFSFTFLLMGLEIVIITNYSIF